MIARLQGWCTQEWLAKAAVRVTSAEDMTMKYISRELGAGSLDVGSDYGAKSLGSQGVVCVVVCVAIM